MLTEFQKSYFILKSKSPCESAVSQFNLATTEFTVRVVAMHTLVYSGHVEYDKDNDTMSPKVNTAAPWSHGGSLEHNVEPDQL